jgi:acetyl esterase/lipase
MPSDKLAPEIRALLEAMAADGAPPMETLSIPEAREVALSLNELAGDPEVVARVEDRKIAGRSGDIPVRIYVPAGDGPFPGVVFLHGGGWVIGGLDTHDNICRAIARRAGAVVVSVDYRLAPEHPFPAALEDSVDAAAWVADNAAALAIDPRRLVIAGDSAGGALSTIVAAKARDTGGPAFALQVLVYPVADLSSFDTASHAEFAEDHFLTRSLMEWFATHYIPRAEDRTRPDASPACIADLRGLPPALVITAECDPLRDEGEAYAKRMQEAGVPVTLTRYAGMIHPFLHFVVVTPNAHKALDEIASAIRSLSPS